MQTAAKNNLFLTDVSSKESFDTKYSGRLYQQIVLTLIRNSSDRQQHQVLAQRLIAVAENAYMYRQMDVVDQSGSLLIGLQLSRRYEAIGHYYKALATLRRNDPAEARLMLASVIQDGPPLFKGKAMLSVGATFRREGNVGYALEAWGEAPRASRGRGSENAFVSYISQHSIAILKSHWGDHRNALADLEKLWPMACALSPFHPQQYYSYLNSLAVELAEVGRTAEAGNICGATLASPYAHAYPEWRETAEEIATKSPRRSSTVVIQDAASVGTSNVFPIVADRNISSSFPESSRQLPEQQARVLSFANWKTQMSREPLAKPKPRVSVGQMTRKQKIIRIVDLVCNEISDEQLDSILQAVERIAPDEKVKD